MARKGTRKSVDKTPDIRAVAALAKVSIATVSRTINGSPVVSERLSDGSPVKTGVVRFDFNLLVLLGGSAYLDALLRRIGVEYEAG